MLVRPLKLEDAAALAEHSHRTMSTSGLAPTPKFVVHSRFDLPTVEVITARHLKSFALPVGTPGWARCFGLFDTDGQIRGEAGLRSTELKNATHRAWLWLGLESDQRGQGGGRRLMDALLAWAQKETQLAWIDLGVFAHNQPARRLYESLGFIETGRLADAYRIDGDSVDDITMTLDLSQCRWAGSAGANP